MERSKNSLRNIVSGLAIAASISGADGQIASAQEIPVEPDGSSSTLEVNSSGNVLEENGFTLGSTPVEVTPEATPVVVDLSETSEATLEQDVNGNYIFVQNDGTRIPVTRIDHVMINNQLTAPEFGVYEFPVTPPGNGGYLVSGVFQKYDIISHEYIDPVTNKNVAVQIVRFWLNLMVDGENFVIRTNLYKDDPQNGYSLSTDGTSRRRVTLNELLDRLVPGQQTILQVERPFSYEELVQVYEQYVGVCDDICLQDLRNYDEVYNNLFHDSEDIARQMSEGNFSIVDQGKIADLNLAAGILTGIPTNNN